MSVHRVTTETTTEVNLLNCTVAWGLLESPKYFNWNPRAPLGAR